MEDHHIQQEKLINKFADSRRKIARNRLILVRILNGLTFLSFIFAMAYYQWVWIEVDLKKNKFDEKRYYFWINLLYLKEDKDGSQYENFGTVQKRICGQDIYCMGIFASLSFVGYLCFSIFVVAGFLQLIDFIKIFWMINKRQNGQIERKDNFRHVVTILTYFVGLSLSAFSISMADVNYHFGVSFWGCIGTLVIFVIVIIYEQISIRRVIQQSLIKDLLEKEVHTRNKKIQEISIQMQGIGVEEDLTI